VGEPLLLLLLLRTLRVIESLRWIVLSELELCDEELLLLEDDDELDEELEFCLPPWMLEMTGRPSERLATAIIWHSLSFCRDGTLMSSRFWCLDGEDDACGLARGLFWPE